MIAGGANIADREPSSEEAPSEAAVPSGGRENPPSAGPLTTSEESAESVPAGPDRESAAPEKPRHNRDEVKEKLGLLLHQAEELKSSRLLLKDRQRAFRKMMQDWKAISDAAHEFRLKQKDRMNQLIAELSNELDWERWYNSMQKEDLCKEAEALAAVEDGLQLSRQVQDLQARWKKLGPSYHKEDEKFWERFKSACDQAFARARAYFQVLDVQRQANALRKRELMVQAEKLVEAESWKDGMEGIRKLKEQWKEAGHAPRGESAELERGFAKACNMFFKKRRELTAELDKKREGNLADKIKLCEKAESWARMEDWRRTLPEIRKLQTQWKATGPVPNASSDEVWKRFSAACDKVFSRKKGDDDVARAGLLENLAKKEALCLELEQRLASGEAEAVMREQEQIKARLDEAGEVPRQDARRITERLRRIVDSGQELLKAALQKREKASEELMYEKAGLLDGLEKLISSDGVGAAKAQAPELRKKWKQLGVSMRNKELAGRFEELTRLLNLPEAEAVAGLEKVRKENLKTRERLCYTLERLAGVESPGVSASLRRELMVEELSAKLGRGGSAAKRAPAEEAAELMRQWRVAGPAPEKENAGLEDRFASAFRAVAGDSTGKRA